MRALVPVFIMVAGIALLVGIPFFLAWIVQKIERIGSRIQERLDARPGFEILPKEPETHDHSTKSGDS